MEGSVKRAVLHWSMSVADADAMLLLLLGFRNLGGTRMMGDEMLLLADNGGGGSGGRWQRGSCPRSEEGAEISCVSTGLDPGGKGDQAPPSGGAFVVPHNTTTTAAGGSLHVSGYSFPLPLSWAGSI